MYVLGHDNYSQHFLFPWQKCWTHFERGRSNGIQTANMVTLCLFLSAIYRRLHFRTQKLPDKVIQKRNIWSFNKARQRLHVKKRKAMKFHRTPHCFDKNHSNVFPWTHTHTLCSQKRGRRGTMCIALLWRTCCYKMAFLHLTCLWNHNPCTGPNDSHRMTPYKC